MSFTPNMPQSGQTLGVTQPLVLTNLAELRSTISNASQPNHIDVNSIGAGKHIFVQMPVQVADAANLPAANEGGLTTQTVAANSELFYARDNVNTYYQMTGSVTKATNGATVVLGGIRIQWFQETVANGAVIIFPVDFGGPPYAIVGNEIESGAVFDFVKPLTAAATLHQFTLQLLRSDGNAQTNPHAINFIAIGPV